MELEMILAIEIIVLCSKLVLSIEIPHGAAVPHAEELKRMILTHVLGQKDDVDGSAMFKYILGEERALQHDDLLARMNISVLDPHSIKKLATYAAESQNKSINDHLLPSRRDFRRRPISDIDQALFYNWDFITRALDLMQQSIHATRYAIKRTRKFRKVYKDNAVFYIGTTYGSLIQDRIKMHTLLATMENYDVKTVKFHWFLIIYEKILATHIDISYGVKRMFQLDLRAKETGAYKKEPIVKRGLKHKG